MAETVDTRVVEAKFDSSQFEKGVNKTVKKLDELKGSLNDLTKDKTVQDFGSKISETSEKASNSLERLQNRFTSFTGMLKQKLISGIADEIVGTFFNIKRSFEGLVKSLSSAQVSVGMQRYTDLLTSVRTLVSAGVNQDKAYESIGRLGEYADQTSYSLDSMVATMSKFKTAGADIDTAARMIEGLSNAAASMGVNAQQAERAYLNLQQAYSKKVMLQNDWISFESLPMVGTQFNQAIIDAALKVGTLQVDKKDKEGNALTYKTKKKAGTKVRGASGITADNLGANLASRWFTDEVMEEVFGNTYYFAEVGIKEVNQIKEKEREIRDEIQQKVNSGELDKGKFDEEVNKELQKYFDDRTKVKIDTKKAEIEERKKTAQLELEAKKANQKEYAEAKKNYDELIKKLDKEMKDFEASNHLSAFAYNAFRAGQEARSFTDVLNTLKDSISRGWATSFELIFGKLDEAADFFTKLTESNFAEGIYKIGEFRNAILQNWRNYGGRENMISVLETIDNFMGSIYMKMGLIYDEEELLQKNFDKLFNNNVYNNILNNQGLKAAEEYVAQMRQAAQEATDDQVANTNPFDKIAEDIGQRLAFAARDIRDFFERIHEWFTEADSTGTSRLQRISNLIDGFGKIVGGTLEGISIGLEGIGTVYNNLKPVFDKLWEAIETVATPIFNLFDKKYIREDGMKPFTMLQDTFNNIGKVCKVISEPLSKVIEILGKVGAFFVSMGVDSFLMNMQLFTDAFGLLLEILGIGSSQKDDGRGVIDGINKSIVDFGDTIKTYGQAIADFFSSVIADIRRWLGLSDEADAKDGNIFKNIEKWFNTNESLKKIKEDVTKFVNRVGDWIAHIPENISKFAINIGDLFKSIFYTKKLSSVTYDSTGRHEQFEWVEKDFVKSIREWFESLPTKIHNLGISIGDLIKSIFYRKETRVTNANYKGEFTKQTVWVEKDFVKNIKKWFKELPGKLKTYAISFGDLIKSIFYTKTTSVTYNDKGRTESVVWLEKEFTTTIKEFIKNIPVHIHNLFAGIGSFASMIWNALTGNNQEDANAEAQKASQDVQNSIDNAYTSISETTILDHLRTVAGNIWNGVLTVFTGNSDKEFNENWIADKVKTGIENIGKWADEAWASTTGFVSTLPSRIAGIFSGEEDPSNAPKEGTVGKAISDFVGKIGIWVSTIPDTLLSFWKDAEKQTSTLRDTIIGWITGENADTKPQELRGHWKQTYDNLLKNAPKEAQESYKKYALEQQWREDNPIVANLGDFFDHLRDYFVDKFTHLPENIASGLSNGANIVQSLLSQATTWLTDDVNKDISKTGDVANAVLSTENSPLLDSLASFGKTLWSIITETIPGFISAGFTWIKKNAESWSESIRGLFSGADKEVETEADSFGSKIQKALANIFKAHTFDQYIYDNVLNEGGYAAAEKYREATSNPIIVFFKNVIKTIGEVFQNVGPVILNGIQTGLNWIGQKLGDASAFLSGLVSKNETIEDVLAEKMVDKETGEENPLWTAIKGIGQTIWDILTKTIPDFISSAASYIAQQVPKLISGIFGGGTQEEVKKPIEEQLADLLEEEQKALDSNDIKKAEELRKKHQELYKQLTDNQKNAAVENGSGILDSFLGLFVGSRASAEGNAEGEVKKSGNALTNIFGTIKDVFNSITKDDTLKWIGIALAIGFFLQQIRAIIDNIAFIDDIGWTAKWTGLSVVMIGITAFLGYLTTLAADDSTLTEADKAAGKMPEKYERIKKVLTDFMDQIKEILRLIAIILGLFAVKEFFSWRKEASKNMKTINKEADKTITQIVKDGEGTSDKIMELFTSEKSPLGMLFGPSGFLGKGLSAFGEGFGGISGKTTGIWASGTMIGQLIENLSGNANEALGQLGSGIRSLSTYLDDAVGNLAKVKTNIGDAIAVVPDIRELITQIISLLNVEIYEQYSYDANTGESIGDYIKVNVISELRNVNKVFNDLSGSLSLFKNSVSGYGDDAQKVTDAIKTIIGSTDSMKAFVEFAEDKAFKTFKEALASFGAIMQLYSKSINDDFNKTPKEINIDGIITLLQQLFGNDKFNSLIDEFSKQNLVNIGDNTFENAEKIIVFASSLTSLAEACNEIKGGEGTAINKLIDEIKALKFGADQTEIDTAVQNFGTLGNALDSFAVNTSGLSEENIRNADYALTMLARIGTSVGQIKKDSGIFALLFGGANEDLGSFGQNIKELGENLADFFVSVDNLSVEGVSSTHNSANLNMMLNALDTLTRVALQFVYLGSGSGAIQAFKDFANNNLKDNFKYLAENLGTFVTSALAIGKVVDDNSGKIEKFNADDFSYIYSILDSINALSNILIKINKLDFTNLGNSNNPHDSPLRDYLNKFITAVADFGSDIYTKSATLTWFKTYKDELQAFLDILDDIYRMMHFTKPIGGSYNATENAKELSEMAKALFGWTEETMGAVSLEKIHHNGIFADIVDFMEDFDILNKSTTIDPNATRTFIAICDVLTSFMETIGIMAKTEAISDYTVHGFTSNYALYVTQLTEVIDAILNNKDKFNEFFEWGKSFNKESVSTVALMMTALNQIVQFVSTMHDTQSFTDVTLTNLGTSQWSRLFGIIQDNIIGENKSFFEPKITPVLEINEKFEADAARLRSLIGLTNEEINVDGKINYGFDSLYLDSLKPTDYSGTLKEINDKLDNLASIKSKTDSIDTTASKFNSSLESMRFVINGTEFVAIIGDQMDQWLGEHSFRLVRTTFV